MNRCIAFFILASILFAPSLLPHQASALSATGGTITYDGSYEIHTFTTSGTFTVTGTGIVDYLVVGGGGGGKAGGGGAGGMLTGKVGVVAGAYTVTVGAGGSGGGTNTAGGFSYFNSINATGGGKGGASNTNGGNGGSGGGAGDTGTKVGGTGSQGNNGGNANSGTGSGGGGGKGSVGSNAVVNVGGNGGSGSSSTISGSSVTYACGGGGGGSTGGSAGCASAGAGTFNTPAGAGSANSGSGGGGEYSTGTNGGAGGSGIVIIKFLPFKNPYAVTDLSSPSQTTTSIYLTWTQPYLGGGAQTLIGYQINATTPTTSNPIVLVNNTGSTNNFYNATGLTLGTTYSIRVSAWTNNTYGHPFNNATGNVINVTTDAQHTVEGTLSFILDNIGDAFRFNGTLSDVYANPSPQTATSLSIYDNNTLSKTVSISDSVINNTDTIFDPIYYQITDNNAHSLKLKVTTTNETGTVTIESAATIATREYDPSYFTASDPTQGLVNYTMSRTSDDDIIDLKINRNKNGNTFNVECLYQTSAQVSYFGMDGTWHNYTSVGFINDTYSNAAGNIIYITCYNDGLLFTVTNYNNSTSLLITGIEAFDSVYGGFIGVPVGVFFLVLVAGYANQRTAPMWIIIILAIAGVMATIGIIDLDTNVWALALIAGLLGLLVGRKFF